MTKIPRIPNLDTRIGKKIQLRSSPLSGLGRNARSAAEDLGSWRPPCLKFPSLLKSSSSPCHHCQLQILCQTSGRSNKMSCFSVSPQITRPLLLLYWFTNLHIELFKHRYYLLSFPWCCTAKWFTVCCI